MIFITSKAEYAVKAFDYDATDYLQKPITNSRFGAAIKRAFILSQLYNKNQEESGDFVIIKSKLKKFKIYVANIRFIEAFGDYVKVVTDNDEHLVLTTMKAFEIYLDNPKLVRVHKSFIVNLDRIDKYNSKIAEIGSEKIPLSRNKKELLQDAFAINQ